ncbi:MAG: NusG domain II-containing protein [Blautia sp.]
MKINRKDMILICSVLFAAVLCWLISSGKGLGSGEEGVLQITVNGEVFGTYPLSQDRTIDIEGSNVCRIKDHKVKMTEANCPDQLCIHQRTITREGGIIVCLPNRVVLEIISQDAPDTIAY